MKKIIVAPVQKKTHSDLIVGRGQDANGVWNALFVQSQRRGEKVCVNNLPHGTAHYANGLIIFSILIYMKWID